MGTIAARKARDIIGNARRVLATEIMAACQAIDFRHGLKLGKGTQAAYDTIRKYVDFVDDDKVMYIELDKCEELIATGELLRNTESEVKIKY